MSHFLILYICCTFPCNVRFYAQVGARRLQAQDQALVGERYLIGVTRKTPIGRFRSHIHRVRRQSRLSPFPPLAWRGATRLSSSTRRASYCYYGGARRYFDFYGPKCEGGSTNIARTTMLPTTTTYTCKKLGNLQKNLFAFLLECALPDLISKKQRGDKAPWPGKVSRFVQVSEKNDSLHLHQFHLPSSFYYYTTTIRIEWFGNT